VIARRAGLAVGGFYQHYHSKRQLLLALMDELLEGLSQLHLRPQAAGDVRAGLRQLLSGAFSRDLRYLGAYRAWQEAALSDPGLARKQERSTPGRPPESGPCSSFSSNCPARALTSTSPASPESSTASSGACSRKPRNSASRS